MSSNQRSRVHQSLRRNTAAAHALGHHPLMHQMTTSDLIRELYAESLAYVTGLDAFVCGGAISKCGAGK